MTMLGSFLTSLAYVVGALVFWWAARQKRLDTEGIGWLALAGFVGGAFGAKLTEWVLGHWNLFASQPLLMLDPRTGGRALLGGLIFGWIAVEIAKWKLGIRRSTGDLFALALPAGEAVGRIGCHFNGCCYGIGSTWFCAVYQHGAWRVPTQLISAFIAFAIFAVLLFGRDKMAREGDLFKAYLLLYGGSRFAIEFLREREIAAVGLSLVQWVCLALALYGARGLWRSQRVRSGVRPSPEVVPVLNSEN
jgi:phosphatidylglycerol:prolipoprotein diacylglycerol transferase